MGIKFCFVAVSLVLLLVQCRSANVFRFATIFGDHMVLQQAPQRATIWGFGEIGQDVLLMFAGEQYRSPILPVGREKVGMWSVVLVPKKFGGPYTIEAHSVVDKKEVTISLSDVLFGDVWVCSGQSNMAFTVIQSDDGAAAINKSGNYRNIRLFTAGLTASDTPQYELQSIELPWSLPSPKTVGGPAWKYFSAVCWNYGVQLYDKLKYPIGLVATSWGGTPVEAWSSPDALKKCNVTGPGIGPEQKRISEESSLHGPHDLSNLWNAMIFPFLNMTIYGAIWYQGEANARSRYSYNCTFPAMIDDWRAKWYESSHQTTAEVFPFGFVQLSAVGNTTTGQSQNFPELRWNQTAQYGFVPNNREKNVFMAVAMDLGNPTSKYGSIHPTDKTDVGKRLALAGLAVAYKVDVYHTGPLLSRINTVPQSATNVLEVTFGSVDEKIEVRSSDGFEALCNEEWLSVKISAVGKFGLLIELPPKCVAKAVAIRLGRLSVRD